MLTYCCQQLSIFAVTMITSLPLSTHCPVILFRQLTLGCRSTSCVREINLDNCGLNDAGHTPLFPAIHQGVRDAYLSTCTASSVSLCPCCSALFTKASLTHACLFTCTAFSLPLRYLSSTTPHPLCACLPLLPSSHPRVRPLHR